MKRSIKVFAFVSALFFMPDVSLLAGGVSGSENESGQGDESSKGAGAAGKREGTGRGRRPRPDDAGRGRSARDIGGFRDKPDRFEKEWGSGATGGFRGMDEGVDRGRGDY